MSYEMHLLPCIIMSYSYYLLLSAKVIKFEFYDTFG